MENKFRTPKIDCENIISFTCSTRALDNLIEHLTKLKSYGEMGCSRNVEIHWDGDGSHRLNNLVINGLNLQQWKQEKERLNNIHLPKLSSETEERGVV